MVPGHVTQSSVCKHASKACDRDDGKRRRRIGSWGCVKAGRGSNVALWKLWCALGLRTEGGQRRWADPGSAAESSSTGIREVSEVMLGLTISARVHMRIKLDSSTVLYVMWWFIHLWVWRKGIFNETWCYPAFTVKAFALCVAPAVSLTASESVGFRTPLEVTEWTGVSKGHLCFSLGSSFFWLAGKGGVCLCDIGVCVAALMACYAAHISSSPLLTGPF